MNSYHEALKRAMKAGQGFDPAGDFWAYWHKAHQLCPFVALQGVREYSAMVTMSYLSFAPKSRNQYVLIVAQRGSENVP